MDFDDILKVIRRKKVKNHYRESERFTFGLPLKEEQNKILHEYFLKTGKYAFPIGTKYKPYHQMSNLELSNVNNYVFFPLDPKEVTTILLLSLAGTFKTRLAKRFAYYYQKAKYAMFIFDAKEDDWLSSKKKGETWGLYRGNLEPEKPDKMRIKCYVAPFVNSEHISESLLSKFTKAGNPISSYDNSRDWSTLGFTGAAPVVMRQLIVREKLTDTDKLLKAVMNKNKLPKYQPITKQAIARRLDPMIYDGFFDETSPELPLMKDWMNGYAISYHTFAQDPKYVQTMVGKLMQQMKQVTTKVRIQSGSAGFPKMVICDDAGVYAQSDDMIMNLASYYLINSINLWRRLGFNMMFLVQSPALLSSHILNGIKHIFVGRIGNFQELFRFGITEEIYKNCMDLNYAPEKHVIEYIWIFPDRKNFVRFYPLNCPIGHEQV